MLRYEWTNHLSPPPPNIVLSNIDIYNHNHNHNHNHHLYNPSSSSTTTSIYHHMTHNDPFTTPCTFPHDNTPHNPHEIPLYSFSNNNIITPQAFALESLSSIMQIPKSEPEPEHEPNLFPTRPIGLNLGRRTYFSSNDDLMNRLYFRSRIVEPAVHSPKCQVEGCNVDLSHAKNYHRRHKVCEFHSKASTVVVAGLTQRFCQQCSRFHLISEFDNGKRSCRKRLADHNRRRRKTNQRITSPCQNNPRSS